jgi:hypothetical protein
MVPDRVIPVIFLPGVMGSNLRGKETISGTRWRLDSISTILPWASRGASDRKTHLRPGVMEVDGGGALPKGTAQSELELQARGWGEVSALSYAEFLVWLENALSDYEHAKTGERAQLMDRDLQALSGEAKPTREEIGLSYRYRFPVYACGYNWLASNSAAATRLAQRIDDVIARYRSEQKKCEKVILVTHSMGGLVARHCSEVLGMRDKIMGIVHGVMPATGAAAVYRRFKAGSEDYTARYNLAGALGAAVLGNDAAEMTAVLSSAPGPLQLLPGVEYGNHWLLIKDRGSVSSFPEKGDPYNEIYTVRGKWWGLCDDQLINPLNNETDPKKRQIQVDADWMEFTNIVMKIVKPFHEALSGKYHPLTYSFFGSDADYRAYQTVTWQGAGNLMTDTIFPNRKMDVLGARALSIPELQEETLSAPELKGERHVNANYADGGWMPQTQRGYFISAPDAPGDGTVPHSSGFAPKPYCKGFLQARVAHEPAYKHTDGPDTLRACRFVLRSIVALAQEVRHTGLRYE